MDKRTIFEIYRMHDMGMKERKIARRLGISRPSVRKYLAHPDITRVPPAPKTSKLDPHYDTISELLEGWPNASASVIKQRIDAQGYTGGITILRDYLQAIRGHRKQPKAYIRFESPPGRQFQFDWGHFGSLTYGKTSRKLYCMTVIECHSRMLYLEFTHSQTQQAVMRTLLNAFLFFNGTAAELVHDYVPRNIIMPNKKMNPAGNALLINAFAALNCTINSCQATLISNSICPGLKTALYSFV